MKEKDREVEPREPFEFACFDDAPTNNGWYHTEWQRRENEDDFSPYLEEEGEIDMDETD